MPVKGIREVNRNFAKLTKDIAGQITEKTLTQVLIVGAAEAARITPVDTSNLINSQFRRTTPTGNGWTGMVGYTANYAGFVHGAKGTLAGQPRANGNGAYWSQSGEPEFLRKGFEVYGIDQIRKIIINGYRLK